MSRKRSRIVLCGEVFSPNLGDQAIAVCMKHLLAEAAPHHEIQLLDLSGRSGANDAPRASSNPSKVAQRIRSLGPLSRRLLNAFTWLIRDRRKFVPRLREALRGAHLIVIGGGQLIADNDWFFPLRLGAVSREAKRNCVPVLVFGCGVGTTREGLGAWLLRRVLTNSVGIVVRDAESMARVRLLVGGHCSPTLTMDPAVLSSEVLKTPKPPSRTTIGLGILSPSVLVRHAPAQDLGEEWWAQFWVALVLELKNRAMDCELFTNGDAEDLRFAEIVQRRLVDREGIMPIRHAKALDDLVSTIREYKAIVAHRLHASIIAFSVATPSVGLKWDSKVSSFYDRISRTRFCVDASRSTAAELAALVVEAAAMPAQTELVDAACMEVRQSLGGALRDLAFRQS